MKNDDVKHVAGFVGLMVAGMGCMYLFVKLMAIASYLDNNL